MVVMPSSLIWLWLMNNLRRSKRLLHMVKKPKLLMLFSPSISDLML